MKREEGKRIKGEGKGMESKEKGKERESKGEKEGNGRGKRKRIRRERGLPVLRGPGQQHAKEDGRHAQCVS